MADRNELIEVTLTEDRIYRSNDGDTTAVHVPKGPAKVPRWVAEHWGLAPVAPGPNETVDARAKLESWADEHGAVGDPLIVTEEPQDVWADEQEPEAVPQPKPAKFVKAKGGG